MDVPNVKPKAGVLLVIAVVVLVEAEESVDDMQKVRLFDIKFLEFF